MSATARLDRHRPARLHQCRRPSDCADELHRGRRPTHLPYGARDRSRSLRDRAPGGVEVDQVDEFLGAGWSVLVTGEASEITSDELRMLDLSQAPDPWPEGWHSIFLQLPLTKITGRRVHQA